MILDLDYNFDFLMNNLDLRVHILDFPMDRLDFGSLGLLTQESN